MSSPCQSTPDQDASGFRDVLVSVRSLAEYRAMFDLTDAELSGKILDCPGGAVSITAEARRGGIDVVAVDPTYPPTGSSAERGRELRKLGEHAAREAERGHEWIHNHPASYVWTVFDTPQDHLAERRRAAATFTAHASVEPQHYVQASLPRLPFPDRPTAHPPRTLRERPLCSPVGPPCPARTTAR